MAGDRTPRWVKHLIREQRAINMRASLAIEGHHVSIEECLRAIDGESPADAAMEAQHALADRRTVLNEAAWTEFRRSWNGQCSTSRSWPS